MMLGYTRDDILMERWMNGHFHFFIFGLLLLGIWNIETFEVKGNIVDLYSTMAPLCLKIFQYNTVSL